MHREGGNLPLGGATTGPTETKTRRKSGAQPGENLKEKEAVLLHND